MQIKAEYVTEIAARQIRKDDMGRLLRYAEHPDTTRTTA